MTYPNFAVFVALTQVGGAVSLARGVALEVLGWVQGALLPALLQCPLLQLRDHLPHHFAAKHKMNYFFIYFSIIK